MEIKLAHIREQGIDFIVFDADASARTREARAELLADLVDRARADGLHVDKAALAYRHGGRIEFFGTPDLVQFLACQEAAFLTAQGAAKLIARSSSRWRAARA